MDLKEIACKDVEWLHMALDGDQWQVLEDTVINLQFP
jgi:hypothetical protein